MNHDLKVGLADQSYPILFRHRAPDDLIERLRALASGAQIIVISDETVSKLHAKRWVGHADSVGLSMELIGFPAGEAYKTLDTASQLIDACLSLGVTRDTVIVAFGGGVVGDLAGFVAATLLRGVRWVQVPTTVLSQVDSSVGGKTGVNHPLGKNLIGAFHQPSFVFVDTAWLETLPVAEVSAGAAEAIKHGAVADKSLLERFSSPSEGWLPSLELLRDAVAIKARIVEEDAHEEGVRMILNFGHTLGHAIESACPTKLRHGEAVALGMVCAAERSVDKGLLSVCELKKLTNTLAGSGLNTDWRPWVSKEVLDRVALDKKSRGHYINDVLLDGLGHAKVVPVLIQTWQQDVRSLVRSAKVV